MRAFVPRQDEIAQLRGGVDGMFAARGGLFLLAGEPGIGKTRLAEEMAREAEARGAQALWGRCWEGDGAPAFWLWIQLVRGLGVDFNDGRAAVETEPERFRLFDWVVTLLLRAAKARPIVLIADDLHWADRGSLLLLKLCARSLRGARLLVVGTYRDVEAELAPETRSLLADIAREGRTLSLGGLDESAAFVFAGGHGVEPESELVQALHRTTRGNPFFMGEIVDLLGAAGIRARSPGEPLPLPASVRETVQRRLELCPAAVRSALPVAAAVGREFSLSLVAEVAGAGPSALRDAMAAATALRVTVALGDDRFSFAHDLVREVVVAAIEPVERARIHAGLAAAMQRRGDAARVSEIAHHLLAADLEGRSEEAVDYAIRAGREAMREWAYEEAVRYFDRALARRAKGGHTGDLGEAELLLELGKARMKARDVPAAQEVCLRAAEIARRLDAPRLIGRAGLVYGEHLVFGRVDPTLVALLEEALDRVDGSEPEDRTLKPQVMARLGAALQPAVDPTRALALARGALALARATGDDRLLLATLHAARPAFRPLESTEERIAIDGETAAVAGRLGDHVLAAHAQVRLVYDLVEAGDVVRADEHLDAYEALANRHRLSWHFDGVEYARAMRALMSGRFQEAERHVEAAQAAAERQRALYPVTAPAPPHALFLFTLGSLTGRREAIADVLSIPDLGGVFRSMASALIHARLGDRRAASLELDRVAEGGLPGSLGLVQRFMLAEVCAFVGDERRAPRLYELLLPYARRNIVWVPFGWCEGSVARLLAPLALLCQREGDAARHFEYALAMNERLGARPYVALTQIGYAELLIRRGAPGDGPRAGALLAAARATCEALGMKPGLAHIEQLGSVMAERSATGPARPPSGTPPRAKEAEKGSAAQGAPVLVRLVREGELWAVDHAGLTLRFKDSDGMRYLARLLAAPNTSVHVTDLLAEARGARGRAGPSAVAHAADLGVRADLGDAGPLLDAKAKAAYARRIEDLEAELDEAEGYHDRGRAAKARGELEALQDELARAVGLGGRDRMASAAAERARVNVTLRIRKAIARIAERSDALGHHLGTCVRTGTFCVYVPPPAK